MNWPKIFRPDATVFTAEGIGELVDSISCQVTEELNGEYYLSLEYPFGGIHQEWLVEGCIIVARPGPYIDEQPFRISSIRRTLTRLTVTAHHISRDMKNIPVYPPLGSTKRTTTVANLISAINTHKIDTKLLFLVSKSSVNTNIPHQFFYEDKPRNLYDLLLGNNSIVSVYTDETAESKYARGEWSFLGYRAVYQGSRGRDVGTTFNFGVDITAGEYTSDVFKSCSSVYPFWQKDVDGETAYTELPERIISFPLNQWLYETCDTVDRECGTRVVGASGVNPAGGDHGCYILDLTSEFDEQPSETELRDAANAYIAEHMLNNPAVTITLSIADKARTSDFSDLYKTSISSYYRPQLGDSVTIDVPQWGISSKTRVTKLTYDPIRDVFTDIETGDNLSNQMIDAVIKGGN